ncbi:MAG: septum formation initiator family protein [Eubacteriales bacterium]|nr:septum formation initiator family protein [Eubacteriales bacterium]
MNNITSRIAMICLTVVIGLVAVNIYSSEKTMRQQEKTYIEREASLNRQIEEEEQRTKELNEKKKYVATNQYIEQVAKEKLGLLNPDEILIKAKNE